MAVTLTQAELSAALRLSDTAAEIAEATRLLAYATQTVTKNAPSAPDVVHNEAVIRLAGYLFDQPFAARGAAFEHSLRNSGAARMLLPYRIHRAGTFSELVAEAEETGTAGNPVISVTLAGTQLVIGYLDGTIVNINLPAGGGGGVSESEANALIATHDAAAASHAAAAAAAVVVAAAARAAAVETHNQTAASHGTARAAAIATGITTHGNDSDAHPPLAWDSAATYSRGAFVVDGGRLYLLVAATSGNQKPSLFPSLWRDMGAALSPS